MPAGEQRTYIISGRLLQRVSVRKQIQQNAVVMNDGKVTDINFTLTEDMFPAEGILLRKGKKSYCRVVLK